MVALQRIFVNVKMNLDIPGPSVTQGLSTMKHMKLN